MEDSVLIRRSPSNFEKIGLGTVNQLECTWALLCLELGFLKRQQSPREQDHALFVNSPCLLIT